MYGATQTSLTPIESAIIALVAALVASWITHLLASRRDRINEQRKQRAGYLLDAFCRLVKSSNVEAHEAYPDTIEAIVKIQALGTRKQIELCLKFITEMIEVGESNIDDLVENIRMHLREELGSEPIDLPIMWYRSFPLPNLTQKPDFTKKSTYKTSQSS